jgi:flagellar assembly protein FliH
LPDNRCGSDFKFQHFPAIDGEAGSCVAGAPARADGFRLFRSDGPGRDADGSSAPSAEELEALDAAARAREEAAHARGFAEGEKAGVDMGRQRVAPVLKQMRQTLVELEKLKKRLVVQAEAESVTLALAVARKIVRQEIQTDRNVVLNTVRAALEKVVERDHVRIHLNPRDLDAARETEGFSALTGDMGKASFESDASVDAGGCLVETRFGDIDARVENQMQWLEETFLNELKKIRPSGGRGPA